MVNQLNEIPSSLEPIGYKQLDSGKKLESEVTAVWYKFFTSLSGVLSNLIGGVLGFTSESGVAAAGTTQATALQMTTEWLVVTTTPVNSGVMVAGFGAGVLSQVLNRGANTLKIYPPVGGQIDALGVNNPYPLPTNKTQFFSQTDIGQFYSTQLG